MLKKIRFKNYRAFKSWQEIELKPLTILVGPNSAGKSSILKLFGMLFQSQSKVDNDYFTFNGPYADLGNPKSIAGNTGQPVSIEIQTQQENQKKVKQDKEKDVKQAAKQSTRFRWDIRHNQTTLNIKTTNFNELRFLVNNYLQAYELEIIGARQFQATLWSDKNQAALYRKIGTSFCPILDWVKSNGRQQEYSESKIHEIIAHDIESSAVQSFSGNGLFPTIIQDEFLQYPKSLKDIRNSEFQSLNKQYLDIKEGPDVLDATLILNREKSDIDSILNLWNEILYDIDPSKKSNNRWLIELAFALIANWIECQKQELLTHSFKRINSILGDCKKDYFSAMRAGNHIEPIRELKGSLFTSEELKKLLGLSVKFNDVVKEFLNQSLRLLQYPYTIDIVPVNGEDDLFRIEFIHKGSKKRIPLSHMGFGFSQVLPVIFAAIKPGINLIEQPELHLHPAAQSQLAQIYATTYLVNIYGIPSPDSGYKGRPARHMSFLDSTFSLFVPSPSPGLQGTAEIELKPLKRVRGMGINIIETHSEHMIRGLQLLVAKGNLKTSDVNIYYVSKNRLGNSHVKKMELLESGFFADKWPPGFFDSATKLQEELWETNR
jgi:predicted ATPase